MVLWPIETPSDLLLWLWLEGVVAGTCYLTYRLITNRHRLNQAAEAIDLCSETDPPDNSVAV